MVIQNRLIRIINFKILNCFKESIKLTNMVCNYIFYTKYPRYLNYCICYPITNMRNDVWVSCKKLFLIITKPNTYA